MLFATSTAITFYFFFTASKVGKSGITVKVAVNGPSGSNIISVASATAATEVDATNQPGLFSYTLTSGNTATEGGYAAHAYTTDTTVDQQHLEALEFCYNWVGYVGGAGGNLNSGKTGYSLSGAGIQAIWDALTSALTTANSIGKRLADDIDAAISSRLAPTTASRTLDVSATGEAGLDWANIGAPTTTVDLSGTTIKNVDNAIANVTTVATTTNLTNAPGAGDFTAAMKTSLNAATPASVVGAVGSVTGSVGGNVTGSVGSVLGNVAGNVTGSVGSVLGNVAGSVASVVGNVGGNVVGSVGSVLGNVAGSVASVVGNVGGNVVGSVANLLDISAAALAKFFTQNSGKVYADAVAGSVVKEIAANAATSPATIANAVWDALLSGHTVSSTFGWAISAIKAMTDKFSLPGLIFAPFFGSPDGAVKTIWRWRDYLVTNGQQIDYQILGLDPTDIVTWTIMCAGEETTKTLTYVAADIPLARLELYKTETGEFTRGDWPYEISVTNVLGDKAEKYYGTIRIKDVLKK